MVRPSVRVGTGWIITSSSGLVSTSVRTSICSASASTASRSRLRLRFGFDAADRGCAQVSPGRELVERPAPSLAEPTETCTHEGFEFARAVASHVLKVPRLPCEYCKDRLQFLAGRGSLDP